MQLSKSLYSSSNWPIYAFIFICSVLLQFTDLEFVTTEKVYNAYQEQEEIENYGESYADEFAQDLEELEYDEEDDSDWNFLYDLLFDAIVVSFETIKFPYIAFILLLGFELFFGVRTVTFSKLLKITMISEIVFLVQDGIQQLYLLIFIPERTMNDIIYSKPLAIKSLLGSEFEYSKVLDYFIGYFDLFEVGYILMLAWGFAYLFQQSFKSVTPKILILYSVSQVLVILLEVFIFEVMI